ncbi:MAG TPA: hypothetical protein DEG17_00895 [Cyanobacteria bacterium UBA11149]|nr:hypothetical protein [Cyanobacteria bacterium UBA11367]HBE59102.1 hypothetical protein [Cyanobacteria bacterium UBA11366]HBK64112.1 hypothetical protein [Cyanobacteria bacterium UBA11166]HBR74814.1 hypothetical protein [Cyanobacteria bacterium UBA11159]HBS67960.1 hypothetical protein [Cyanobacteria bacterium UBA11153]HBW87470.1 hypothetical protein [Cyanobacteria bacterium UBA11149]HCA94067.1 hypothetical protein [Cyanobacteria bacterium UBA9226]
MSLSQQELKQHCQYILKSRRIKNKIVVLCEGGIKEEGRLSPQSYGKMEQMPDSNFYQACVPKYWNKNYRPQFFNCGDRQDVIDTYFALSELHAEDSSNSYLTPEKLFAIVDLDLQVKTIDNYSFPDTEAIFYSLYEKGKVNDKNAINHRIWVTGLIYKEAYFIVPELQPIFDNYLSGTPIYKGNPIVLEKVYMDMVDGIDRDMALQEKLQTASKRISYCAGLDCTGVDKLQDSWKTEFQNAQDETSKNQLIYALLTIKQVKDYWHKIQPPIDWTREVGVYRDMLLLQIAEFYKEKSSDTRYHIPVFLKTLYEEDCRQHGII